MWTTENRNRDNRDRLCYPSDLTDAEWVVVEPLIAPASAAATGAMSMFVRSSTG